MGRFTYIFQEGRIDHGSECYQWEVLGDSEPICGVMDCFPWCDEYLNYRSRRRYVLHDVAEGQEQSNRLQLCQLMTWPDSLDFDWSVTSGGVNLVDMLRADRIKPVTVRTDIGDPFIEGFPLEELHNTHYHKPITQWVWCGMSWELEWACREVSYMAGRWVIPILRIVNWPGWQIRLRLQGQMPHCVQWGTGSGSTKTIAQLRFSINHAHSWSFSMAELNQEQELWQHVSDDYCQTQEVDFYLFADVLFCDTVLDMWLVSPDDDRCYSGLPIADRGPFCEGPTLNITEARLFKL